MRAQQGTGRGGMIGASTLVEQKPGCAFEGRITCHYSGTQKIKGKLYCPKHAEEIKRG
jgi:hypothetical protein